MARRYINYQKVLYLLESTLIVRRYLKVEDSAAEVMRKMVLRSFRFLPVPEGEYSTCVRLK